MVLVPCVLSVNLRPTKILKLFKQQLMGYPLLAKAGLAALASGGAMWGRKKLGKHTRPKIRVNQRTRKNRARIQGAGVRQFSTIPSTVPRSQNRDFVYAYHGALNSSATQNVYGTEDYFKLNDIFDPAVGAAADQPLFYDQYAALYGRYRVYAATVEVRFMSLDTAVIAACAASIQPSASTTTLTAQTGAYVQEMPLTTTLNISPHGEHTWLMERKTFTMNYLEGESAYTHGDDYEAAFGASPAVTPYIRIAVANRGAAATISVVYNIRITYHTRIWNPLTAAQSL